LWICGARLRINERISSFFGLNNLLDPASADYREGMAYECTNSRLSKRGLWTGAPTTGNAITPTTAITGGTGQRQMTKDGVSTLITGIDVATEGQNGYVYYLNAGGALCATTGGTVLQADVAAPTILSAAADSSGSSLCRISTGLYYYMLTDYNPLIKRESLPSYAIEVSFDKETDLDSRVHIATSSAVAAGLTRRVYRSSSTTPTKFYYLGDMTTTTYDDYRNDGELTVEYEGRGTVLLDPDFIVSYGSKMLYFKANTLWWSSAGRPEEVAQKYTVHFVSGAESQDMTSYPRLENGYGEAKKEIIELSGSTITGAIEKDGKLWIFTKCMVGYLVEVNNGEGYVFKVHRRGVGVLSQFCLQSCEHGVFGFDGQGMWLLDNSNRITRLTDNRVDISTFYVGSPTFTGIWCPNLNEYWMCNGTIVIPYQADRKIFVGHYTLTFTAGCSWYDEDGAWGLIGTDKIVEGTGEVNLTFYLGQTSPTTIKQTITVEVVQAAASTLTLTVTPLARKDMTGTATTTNDTTSAVRCTADSAGRMVKAQVALASSENGGISTINYRYDPIEWSPENGR
jgi:hypothetical protein